jgi:hypothetical protein
MGHGQAEQGPGVDGAATPSGRKVIAWLEQAIIGMQLCPFAAVPWRNGRVRIAVSSARTPEDAVRDALEEAWTLLTPDPDEPPPADAPPRPETTLLAFPETAHDFETLLDIGATVEDILAQAGGEGLLQVITFHPAYVFEGEDPDDPGSWTNRAPVPLLHLLREDEVSRAVEQHPDTLSIPARNVKLLREMGLDTLRALWRTFDAASVAG